MAKQIINPATSATKVVENEPVILTKEPAIPVSQPAILEGDTTIIKKSGVYVKEPVTTNSSMKERGEPVVTEKQEPIVLNSPVKEKPVKLTDMKVGDLGKAENVDRKLSAKEINTNDPNVSCRVVKKHECTIARVEYSLLPGKDIVLPNSVATILANEGIVIKR